MDYKRQPVLVALADADTEDAAHDKATPGNMTDPDSSSHSHASTGGYDVAPLDIGNGGTRRHDAYSRHRQQSSALFKPSKPENPNGKHAVAGTQRGRGRAAYEQGLEDQERQGGSPRAATTALRD